jgi:hypothetical protein
MEVLGVGSLDLGGDPRDTEASGHGKVRDHSDSKDHSGQPTHQYNTWTRVTASNLPVEDPRLPLDPSREDKDTNDTKGEEGEDDPKGGVSSMGRVQESSLGLRLIISIAHRSGMADGNRMNGHTHGPWGKGRWCSGPPWWP